MQEFKEETL